LRRHLDRQLRHYVRTGVAACLIAFAVADARAQDAPRFNDYPATQTYRGKSAQPKLTTKDARRFRTMLRQAAEGKANFAGHFIVAKWGCGTACVMGAIIDARSGAVTMLPFTLCCWRETYDDFQPFAYRLDSRLIVFLGQRNEEGENGYHAYVFDNGRLRFLRTAETGGDFPKPPP
jgi:hypothetical protein